MKTLISFTRAGLFLSLVFIAVWLGTHKETSQKSVEKEVVYLPATDQQLLDWWFGDKLMDKQALRRRVCGR